MKSNQFVEQERRIRPGVHFHGGVWWRTTFWQCCQPLNPLQEIVPGAAAPAPWRSALKYSHLVPARAAGNTTWMHMLLDGEPFRDFRFEVLPHEKRKAINRGRNKQLKVERLDRLDRHWEDLQQIYMSTAARTTYGLKSEYYKQQEAEWKAGLQREFELPDRDWFGVSSGGKLIGFLYSCLIEDTAFLIVTKYNDDFRLERPSDYLHFEVINYYKDQTCCTRISAGRSVESKQGIDRFKAGFGFRHAPLPAFERTNVAALLGAKALLRFGVPVLDRVSPTVAKRAQYFAGRIEGSLRQQREVSRDGDRA